MDTTSLWHAISNDHEAETYPTLTNDIEVDVAIIGGGITGLTTAEHLIRAGKKVAILEAFRIGDGTTGNSTGNLYIETQPYFHNIAKKFNLETARTIAHSRKKAIDEIENNVQEKNIDCNFSRRPWYLFTDNDDEISFLKEETEIFQKMDIDLKFIKDLPLPFTFKKAAHLPNQARINPLKYVRGLAKDLHNKNCLIYENTKVDEYEEKGLCLITTSKAKVKAKKLVIATHTPIGVNPIQMFTAAYRSYVVAVHLSEDRCPEGHFWGIGQGQNISSTHPFRSDYPELLLVAGSHHKTGQAKDAIEHFRELENYIKKQFRDYKIEHKWSAQHYQSADDVPYIGLAKHSGKNTYIATGFFADGLIYGTIAGKVLADLIVKEKGELEEIYDPSRPTLIKSIPFAAKENINVFYQYLKDLPWIASHNYDDIKAGEGRVVEINSEKCAVSRDENNKLHVLSAVCTHMKCVVNWNNAEQTWDCPCHGSRFSREGKVLEGPAITDLERKKI